MFKITVASEDEKTVTLKLDGGLTCEYLTDLKKLCLSYRDEKNKAVALDFSGVTFIDNQGVTMLENIKDEHLKITNCSLFIEALLNKLVSDNKN